MFFSLPVLMYHSISRFKHRLCVRPELFEEHCATLTKDGWRGISLAEAETFFLKKKRLPKKVCLFTFDDGYLDNYVHAEPILRQYGHYGVLFPVAAALGQAERLRPTRDAGKAAAALLRSLDTRQVKTQSCCRVYQVQYCDWREVRQMHEHGHLAAAPHSLRHDRIVKTLLFKNVYTPPGGRTIFGLPPFQNTLWGMPIFPLGHALASPGCEIASELFALVEKMVPQDEKEARTYLANPENKQALMEAIRALPSLGEPESEAAYRERLAAEFTECRRLFAKMLGKAPISFCWPWGDYSAIALEEARKAGFRIFFSTWRGPNTRHSGKDVHRIAVRSISGEELLTLVRNASNSLLQLPYRFLKSAFAAGYFRLQ